MMDLEEMDDLKPEEPLAQLLKESLDRHSLEELDQRVKILEAEISRVKQTIKGKQASLSAADDFFSNKGN